jgi:vacuolar-type H+-ATPase subunit D/Vma8
LKRLAIEIWRIARRLNGMENRLIPEMIAERGLIRAALDERERWDHFRLKLVKKMLQRGRQER